MESGPSHRGAEPLPRADRGRHRSQRRRGGQAVQLGIGLLLAFAYLAADRVLAPLGYAEVIPPAVAAWAPHAAFLLLAIVLLWRAPK